MTTRAEARTRRNGSATATSSDGRSGLGRTSRDSRRGTRMSKVYRAFYRRSAASVRISIGTRRSVIGTPTDSHSSLSPYHWSAWL